MYYGLVPAGSHTYRLDFLGSLNQYIFLYDGTQWDQSDTNISWQPARVEYASETLNRADHFPGSNANKVEFWGATYKRLESYYSANLSYGITGGTGIPGLDTITSNNFRTYDTRCWD